MSLRALIFVGALVATFVFIRKGVAATPPNPSTGDNLGGANFGILPNGAFNGNLWD